MSFVLLAAAVKECILAYRRLGVDQPQPRRLSNAIKAAIAAWFMASEITIRSMPDDLKRVDSARRLLYTGKDCFVKTMRDVRPTDLIEHSINLIPDARPVYAPIKR